MSKKTKSKIQSLNALLEIGCEEIPARFMPGFLDDLRARAEEKLKAERITFSKIETLGTYRRLTLLISDVPARQADEALEIKGPPADIGFKDGQPTQAALGFARTQGVKPEQLIVKPAGKKDYVFAQVLRKGEVAEKVLARVFPEIISSIYQPLAMRWGNVDYKFIRPIHWICALCGNKIVKFELAGVKASNITYGHRYARNPKSKILNSKKELYFQKLAKLGVVVDQSERKELIRKQVEAVAKKAKAAALIEADLLDEVTFLVENPVAYLGRFNKDFLKIPQDVLITSMKKNQKYFPIVDSSGRLQAGFVVVTDGCRQAGVVDGNQKVLSARLADAKFFFDEDKKQPLKMRLADLTRVGFFEKLGMMSDKVARIAKLAEWIGKRLKLEQDPLKIVQRIAELCKADLTTKMVYEFPELQGIIGREYALLAKEDPKVAQGIAEHYLPRHAEDKLPRSLEGTVVALADRFDSLVGCFSVGAIPTGSVDPYGLRRAVNGITHIVLEKKIDLLLDEVIDHSYKLYAPVLKGAGDLPKVKKQILDFIAARLKPYLLDQGLRYDIVDAALADFNDILDSVAKARVLSRAVPEKWFKGVVRSADRVSRIAKNVAREEVREADLTDKEEKDLFELYMKVNWEVGEAENKEEWDRAVAALAALTDPLEAFFDKVLVMHEDERLKTNRLALLKSLEKLYLRVADFRKVVIEGSK